MLTWKQIHHFSCASMLSVQFFCHVCGTGFAQDGGILLLSNDIIAVQANANGRFNIGTTSGTTLTFQYPGAPSTSHTYFRIDGKVYRNRAPAFIPLRKVDAALICAWKINAVVIAQRLTVEQYSESSAAVFMQYLMVNQDDRPHKVGVLLELDTMVNHNDRAPISTSFGYSTSEREFHAPRIPDFFQAFEKDPVTPGLIARGTLRGRQAVAPDRFIVGDWRKLKKVAWKHKSTGAFYGDSAVILRWDERTLQPRAHREVGTYYGMADVVIKKGLLALNVTAPDRLEVVDNRLTPNPFDVVLIITNTAEMRASGIEAELTLPAGLRLVKGDVSRKALHPGSLAPMRSGQIAWRVFADRRVSSKPLNYTIDVQSANIGVSTISSTIAVAGFEDSPKLPTFVDLSPGERQEIRTFAADAITAQRIDPKHLIERFNEDGHEIQFFPLGYYRPFVANNLMNYRTWASRNRVPSDQVVRTLADQQSPSYLDYLFNEIVLNLNPILKSLAMGDSSHLSLTLAFEGFTDHRPVSRILYDGRSIGCGDGSISGLILDNKQLACLRAYFTRQELVKYLEKRSEPYFSLLMRQDRIAFTHQYFGHDGISPESTVISRNEKLGDLEKEEKYSEIRRVVISLSFAPQQSTQKY